MQKLLFLLCAVTLPISASAKTLWQGDFSGNWRGNWGVQWYQQGAAQIRSDDRFSNFLRVNYKQNVVGPNGGTQFWAKLPRHVHGEDRYLSYYVKFSSNFEWKKGGKLPGLAAVNPSNASGGTKPNGYNGYTARYMWLNGNNFHAYLYAPEQSALPNSRWGWQQDTGFDLQSGKWHHIIQRVKLNNVGQSNGLMEAWVDGRKVLSKGGLLYRKTGFQTDGIYFSSFFGGNTQDWAPNRYGNYADFANFSVSDSYPGAASSSSPSTPAPTKPSTSAPTNTPSSSNAGNAKTFKATSMNTHSGVRKYSGWGVGSFDRGEWIAFSPNVTGKSFTLKLSTASTSGGTFEVREGSQNGKVLGELSYNSSGNWNSFQWTSTKSFSASQSNTLYIVMKSGTANVRDVVFTASGNSSSSGSPPSSSSTDNSGSSGGQTFTHNAWSIVSKAGGVTLGQNWGVGSFDKGDWVIYSIPAIKNRSNLSVQLKIATQLSGTIELRDHNCSGSVLAKITYNSTGSWSEPKYTSWTRLNKTPSSGYVCAAMTNGTSNLNQLKFSN